MERHTTPDRDQLAAELDEAEAALQSSLAALRTHGRQGITWAMARYDALRVASLRQRLRARRASGRKK